jgi:hypothetical protein
VAGLAETDGVVEGVGFFLGGEDDAPSKFERGR